MKLLITNGHLNIGGVERSLVNLLKAIDYSEHQVDLLLFEGLGEYRDQIPPEVHVTLCDLTTTYGSAISVIRNAIRQRNGRAILYKLILTLANKVDYRFLRLFRLLHIVDKEYDGALAYRVGFPAEYVSYAVKSDRKLVWWHHGDFDYDDRTVSRWRAMMANMDYVVSVSEFARQMIRPHFPGFEDRMIVVPNMVNVTEIREKAAMFHPYTNRKSGETILVSVGRLSAEKHMGDAVFAAKALIDRGYEDFCWYLIGDGPERPAIEEQIAEFGLDDHVILTGNRENPYPYIRDADIYVHPSHIESQGIAVLEAMALEKLCVVVRSEGTNEYVKDRYNALQAEQTIDSLIKKILEAINMEDSSPLRTNAAETAENYRPERIMPVLMEALF